MNDEGGTLSDLWREERDACMMKEGGKVGVGGGLWEYILLSTGGARGDSMTARSRGTPKGSVHSHSSGGKCQRENV
jgi:hypothetical protein